LPDGGLDVLATLAFRTAQNLEAFGTENAGNMKDLEGLSRTTLALVGLPLEELASEEMLRRVEKRLQMM
jgi:hypothetical protein